MALSVCMMVRNEAHQLERAMASVLPVADQVVVLDTGSTDDTVAAAERMGAKVARFEWCDDFSAAMGAAIALADHEWILHLDADEALMAESYDAVRAAMRDERAMGYRVIRRDLADEADRTRYTQMWQLRLFRNVSGLRYVGRDHPHFEPPLEQLAKDAGMGVKPSEITLEHWGYVRAEDRRRKMERASKLLRLELERKPGQLYYLVELFRTQKELGMAEEATVTLREAMGVAGRHVNDEGPPEMGALLLEMLLQLPPEVLVAPWTPGLVRRCAERWFGDAPPVVWLMAQQDFAAGRYEPAAKKLKQLVKMGRTKRYDMTCSFDPRIIGEDALLNLGVCLTRSGELREAEGVFKELAKYPAKRTQVEANLATVRGLRKRFGV